MTALIIVAAVAAIVIYVVLGWAVIFKKLDEMSNELDNYYYTNNNQKLFILCLDIEDFEDNNLSPPLLVIFYSLLWPITAWKTISLYNRVIKTKEIKLKKKSNAFIAVNTLKHLLLIPNKQNTKKCGKYFQR